MAATIKEYQQAIGKKYKLPPMTGLAKKDGLGYYLKSIPNSPNVSRAAWKVVGWCISRIEKNSERGLKLWADWTCAYRTTTPDEIRHEYMSHSTTNGFGWGVLYKMAQIYNSKMNANGSFHAPLFDDEPTYAMPHQTSSS